MPCGGGDADAQRLRIRVEPVETTQPAGDAVFPKTFSNTFYTLADRHPRSLLLGYPVALALCARRAGRRSSS